MELVHRGNVYVDIRDGNFEHTFTADEVWRDGDVYWFYRYGVLLGMLHKRKVMRIQDCYSDSFVEVE